MTVTQCVAVFCSARCRRRTKKKKKDADHTWRDPEEDNNNRLRELKTAAWTNRRTVADGRYWRNSSASVPRQTLLLVLCGQTPVTSLSTAAQTPCNSYHPRPLVVAGNRTTANINSCNMLLYYYYFFLNPRVYNARELKTDRIKTAEMTRGLGCHQWSHCAKAPN